MEITKIHSWAKCRLTQEIRYIYKTITNNLGKHDDVNDDTILYVCLEEGRRDEATGRTFLSGKLGEEISDYARGFAFEFMKTNKQKTLNKGIQE